MLVCSNFETVKVYDMLGYDMIHVLAVILYHGTKSFFQTLYSTLVVFFFSATYSKQVSKKIWRGAI